MYTDTAIHNMLAAEGTTYLSLHSAYSASGAGEITGGSPAYARKTVTWTTPASRSILLAGAVTFDVPASTVAWIGRWNAVTGGTFLGMGAVQGDEKEFSVDITTNVITQTAHGYLDTNTIVFYGGTPPGGLVEGTTYYVRDKTTDTYKVAATSGGTAIDITTVPAAACVVSKIIPEVFGAQGMVNVPTTFKLTAGV